MTRPTTDVFSGNNDSSVDGTLTVSDTYCINENSFLVARVSLSNLGVNETRFLNNKGDLCTSELNPEELHHSILSKSEFATLNSLTFYIGRGHGTIQLECESCDNGNYHNYLYDLNGNLKRFSAEDDDNDKEERPPELHNIKESYSSIKFYLTDEIAKNTYTHLSNMLSESQDGKYKYVKLIHNCISPMTDIFMRLGIENHFTKYLQQDELFSFDEYPDTMTSAFIHSFYFPSDYTNPSRSVISNYMDNKLGENFRKDYGTKYYKMVVNNTDLTDNTQLVEIFQDAQETKLFYCPRMLAKIGKYQEGNNHCDSNELCKYLDDYDRFHSMTYDELYYSYVLEHIHNILTIADKKGYNSQAIEAVSDTVQALCEDAINGVTRDFFFDNQG